MRPRGFVSIKSIQTADGKPMSTQQAVDYGIVKPQGQSPPGWGIDRTEIPLGWNMWVDSGRQLLTYALGFRSPISHFVCTKFAVGTGTTAPAVADTSLEEAILLTDTNADLTLDSPYKAIGAATFPSPFIIHIEMPLAVGDANGKLITELGLFSEDESIFARKTILGIDKQSDFGTVLIWRLRM